METSEEEVTQSDLFLYMYDYAVSLTTCHLSESARLQMRISACVVEFPTLPSVFLPSSNSSQVGISHNVVASEFVRERYFKNTEGREQRMQIGREKKCVFNSQM